MKNASTTQMKWCIVFTKDKTLRTNQNEEIDEEKRKLEIEHNRENSLNTQAGFMTAAFSFSTTALFTVWQIGLNYIKSVPNNAIHLSVGIVTLFLLLSMLSSISALLHSRDKTYHEQLASIIKSNDKKYKRIRRAIVFWYIALFFVFFSVIYVAYVFYVYPGNIKYWFAYLDTPFSKK